MGAISKALGLKTASAGPNISWDGTFSVQPLFNSFLGWGGRSNAGPIVSVDSSMGLATLYACVRVLAESVAQIPLILYHRLPDGGSQQAEDHHLYPIFHDAPNPEMTSFVWRETIVSHLCTWGNAYCEIAFDQSGRMELWPVSPARIQVSFEGGRKVYDYLKPDGNKLRFPDGKIFHIPGMSSNGLVGMSPISIHRETLGLYQGLQDFGASTMRNMARPSVVMTHPKTLSKGAIERLATQMDELRGSGNAGKTIVMEEGLTLTEVGIPPKDAQYMEARQFQSREVQRMFRMQPHMVQDLEHATFTNIEHQSLDFVNFTLTPWLSRIEQQITLDFLYGEPDYYIKFAKEELLLGDSESRAKALNIQHDAGVLSDNEWRAIEHRNPKVTDNFWQPSGANYILNPVDTPGEQTLPEDQPTLTVVKSAGIRCLNCNHKLAEMATAPYRFTCSKCKAVTEDTTVPEPVKSADPMLGLTEAVIALANREQPTPQITVTTPEIHAELHVPDIQLPPAEPAEAPVVNVHTDSFVEAIADLKTMLAQPRNKRILRDPDGRIVGVEDA